MSRLAVLLLALTLLLPAPAALAQQGGGAFEPLPPAQPTPVPTPAPATDQGDEDVGRTTLYVIGGLLVLSFAALAVWITRDARRAVPAQSGRPAPDPEMLDERRHKMAQKAKVQARKKGRQQRAARRRNR